MLLIKTTLTTKIHTGITKTGMGNLLLNGILEKHGPAEGDHTIEFGMFHPRAAESEG